MMTIILFCSLLVLFFLGATFASFASTTEMSTIDLTQHWVGYASILIFFAAYVLVILEDKLHLRKSKPVLLAAGVIWILIALVLRGQDDTEMVAEAIRHNFLEYAELFFFLLVAMTYINALLERGIFDALRNWLVYKGYSFRTLFWLTGCLAFCISPIADNLTTALIMCAVVMAVGKGRPEFVAITCVNIVVAANAGGAFSPFGDITTLMVWQKGMVEFESFICLLLPSLVNYLLPALIMQLFIPKGHPPRSMCGTAQVKPGGFMIVVLFLTTIITAVSFHNFLHIPPVFGMMLGLGYLKIFAYFLREGGKNLIDHSDMPTGNIIEDDFDIFDKIAKAEWDTLFFFYGVILAVGGLGFIGYLSAASEFIYGELGATSANILVGLLSAIVDNIPVMYAVLTMEPEMNQFQWLLVTLTAGVGGSLFSIGSAAGVALMGQARGQYTFFTHLKWTPVIAIGYAASIYTHFLING